MGKDMDRTDNKCTLASQCRYYPEKLYCDNPTTSGCGGFKTNVMEDGEWQQVDKDGYTVECCDCGLKHEFKFKIKKGKLFLSATRIAQD